MWSHIALGNLLSNAVPKSYVFLQCLQELQIGRENQVGGSDAGCGVLLIFHTKEERDERDGELLIPTRFLTACLSILYLVVKYF